MKKYITPTAVSARVETGVLMEGSVGFDKNQNVSTESGTGGWTRQQIWAEEEEN